MATTTTTKFKLTKLQGKDAHMSLSFLAKKTLPNPLWKYIALNIIELDDHISKMDKFTLELAKKLNLVVNGKIVFDKEEDSDRLNKEFSDHYEADKEIITVSLITLDMELFKEVNLPADLVKVLIKLKIIK